MMGDYLSRLQYWCREGRSMPGYVYGNGDPYIAFLLGLYDGPLEPPFHLGPADLEDRINKHHPSLLRSLEGPHGWAILKMLIVRKAETLTDEENSHG